MKQATPEDKERNKDFFAIVDSKSIKILPYFLKNRTYNSYSIGSKDKFGNLLIGLSWVSPGNGFSKRGLVCCKTVELRDSAEEIIIMYKKEFEAE